FEKFAADCEILDLLQRQFAPLEVEEASLAFDAHVEVGQGGHFFGAQHTLERFRECFWRPTVASTENFERWKKNGSLDHAARASRRWRELLEQYERPQLDEAVEEELVEFVERRAAEVGDTISVRSRACRSGTACIIRHPSAACSHTSHASTEHSIGSHRSTSAWMRSSSAAASLVAIVMCGINVAWC